MFIIILLFILVDIFILGFSHPRTVQVSVSWHERSVVQSLLSPETGDPLPTLFQSHCNSFTAQFWGQRGCFLCSETPWCRKAKACSAALAVLSLQCCVVLCILKTNPKKTLWKTFQSLSALPLCSPVPCRKGGFPGPTMPALLAQLHFQSNPWRIFFFLSPTAGSNSSEVPEVVFIILLHLPLSNSASSPVCTHLFFPIIFWRGELRARCALLQRGKFWPETGTPGHCESTAYNNAYALDKQAASKLSICRRGIEKEKN